MLIKMGLLIFIFRLYLIPFFFIFVISPPLLLSNVFYLIGAFDKLSHRHSVFKVETIGMSCIYFFIFFVLEKNFSPPFSDFLSFFFFIDLIFSCSFIFMIMLGDCYVAVTGLPDPSPDHAVQMAKFARDCIEKMAYLTSRLEVSLGPDTGDLDLRIGIHSGQVTAGVLRGERMRQSSKARNSF